MIRVYKNPMFQSMTAKMLFFVAALMMSALIENILVTAYARKNALDSIIDVRAAALNSVMLQIDNEIAAQNDYVVDMVTANEDYLWLVRQSEVTDGDYQFMTRLLSLGLDMEQRLTRISYEAGYFAIFPNSGKSIYRTRNTMVTNPDIYEFLLEHSEKSDFADLKGISFCEVENFPYIVIVYPGGGGFLGGWLSLDSILHYYKLDQEEDANYDFGRGDFREGWIHQKNTYRLGTVSGTAAFTLLEDFRLDVYSGRREVLFFVCFTVVIAIAVAVFLFWMYRGIIRPLSRLRQAIAHVESGELEYRIAEVRSAEDAGSGNDIERMNLEFNRMLEQIKTLKMDVYEMQLAKQKAELRYLSQQIRPHFILNVLNIIYSYQEKDYPLIREMVMYLTRYFRYIINAGSDYVCLKDEFSHIRNYLNIQKVRYPRHFDFELLLDEGLENMGIPPLIIQSFVENSIKYAIDPNGVIRVGVKASRIDEEHYCLEMYDTGRGYSDTVLREIQKLLEGKGQMKSVGLGNMIERMQMMYKNEVTIEIHNRREGGTYAKFVMPCRKPE